jgi:hypothetical protein
MTFLTAQTVGPAEELHGLTIGKRNPRALLGFG